MNSKVSSAIIIPAVGIVVAGVYLYGTSLIPILDSGDPLGPRAFPIGLAVLLILCSLLLYGERRRQAAKAVEETVGAGDENTNVRLVAGTTAWIAVYFLTFEVIGFPLATAVFLLGAMLFFHREGRVVAVITAIGFAAGAYLLFNNVLDVRLPSGLLGI